jgi:hypothetical protein
VAPEKSRIIPPMNVVTLSAGGSTVGPQRDTA